MNRGDLVTVSLQGDYGKPRPALVIQADLFAETRSRTVLPLTSIEVDAPLIRVAVEPTQQNGLRATSYVMVDKVSTVPADKLGPPFGKLEEAAMIAVTRSLVLFLGLTA